MFVTLIVAGCSKAGIRTPPAPPPPPPQKEEAVSVDYEGTIRVRFVIEKGGTASNIEASGGPEEFQQEAIRVISMSSGNWQPEMFFGHAVRSNKTQPIVFRLIED